MTPLPDGLDAELLGRYLAGECAEAETAAVRRYLMAHPEAARTLEQYLRHLDGGASAPSAPDPEAAWGAMRMRLHQASPRDPLGMGAPPGRGAGAQAPTPVVAPTRRRGLTLAPLARRRWYGPYGLIAVAGVLVLALGIYETARTKNLAAPVAESRIYSTAERQRADLRLADGTRVRIAPGSRLRVAADFGVERRDVFLEGQAFFDVVHDERRPFTVYAGNASAHDLGTAFSVRSYAEDRAVQVIVREGAVAMSGVGRLAPGEVGRLTSEGRASRRRSADAGALLGWLDGQLAYEDAALGLVIGDIERWYGVDVTLADSSLAHLPFTGAITERSSRGAIDLVTATLGLRAERRGGQVVLHGITGRTPRRAGKGRPSADAH